MVTRKPVPFTPPSLAPDTSSHPRTTPVTASPHGPDQTNGASQQATPAGLEPDSASAWREESSYSSNRHGLVKGDALQSDLPPSLRPGLSAYTPTSSQEMLRPGAKITNPYLKKQYDVQGESSAGAWSGSHEKPPAHAPPPPPPMTSSSPLVPVIGRQTSELYQAPPPSQQLENLSIAEPSNNPWQPALNDQALRKGPSSVPPISRQDSGNEAWSDAAELKQPDSIPPSDTSQRPVMVDADEPESPAWDEDDDSSAPGQGTPAEVAHETQQIDEGLRAWGETQEQTNTSTLPKAGFVNTEGHQEQSNGWEGVGIGSSGGQQESGIVAKNGVVLERLTPEEQVPALPPRISQEQPPIQPPRPTLDTTTSSPPTGDRPSSAIRRQKKETYEIKKVTWHDATAAQNPRVSPILVQNANGPCPLLALVNALTISTPANIDTALVETLRSREQVSLGLLLDAVFDELMSGRRGDVAQGLPDVGELYAFLITLHTGMNVNPRFFPPAANKRYSNDPRPSMAHIHPSEREEAVPGTFEDTKEMKLYSTFSVPLIHGWLPERDSPAFAALKKSANSYEDAQNLMFREEELENKLQTEGLSFEEQATLEDIAMIRAFFNTAATQLTSFGLETIANSMAPGAVAILFRNDHFSTLYRHPETLQLLQLVTDMGYASHDEVVWESLIDVSGENAEFFSGDFRLVSAEPQTTAASSQQREAASTTAVGRNESSAQQIVDRLEVRDRNIESVRSPITEQEDHDLALALQLQEEEEERHRNELTRRRQEAELSQQFIEQQSSNQGSNVPVSVRGGRGRGVRGRLSSGPTRGALDIRPLIPPRRSGPNTGGQAVDPEAGVDAPPPTYEQAATQPAYVPSSNQPPYSPASPGAPSSGNRRGQSAYSANAQGLGNVGILPGPSPGGSRLGRRGTGSSLIDQIPGRRPAQGLSPHEPVQKERECVVM